jgi:hypothetical protein
MPSSAYRRFPIDNFRSPCCGWAYLKLLRFNDTAHLAAGRGGVAEHAE